MFNIWLHEVERSKDLMKIRRSFLFAGLLLLVICICHLNHSSIHLQVIFNNEQQNISFHFKFILFKYVHLHIWISYNIFSHLLYIHIFITVKSIYSNKGKIIYKIIFPLQTTWRRSLTCHFFPLAAASHQRFK